MPDHGLSRSSLALNPAIDPHFLTVPADLTLGNVLAMMTEARSRCLLSCLVADSPHPTLTPHTLETTEFTTLSATLSSCVLVMENDQLQGVFTQRDIVRLTAQAIPLTDIPVGEVVTKPAITLQNASEQDIFTALSLFRQHHIRHLPVINHQGYPIGLVTPQSIRRALRPINLLTRLHTVQDVMTTTVIHAPPTASVLDLAQRMSEHQVSCLVICDSSQPRCPLGIVTEGDIAQFQALELDLASIPAQTVMSSPLFSLQPTDSLWFAHQTMSDRRVQRLVVTDDTGELLGLVSQTSLLQVLNPADMYGVIDMLQEAVDDRTAELERTNEQLRYEIAERQRAEATLQQSHDHLEVLVAQKTAQLTQANAQLKADIAKRQDIETELRESQTQLRTQANELRHTLDELQHAQIKLIQTEKMSSLGQLVAGIAHEINNPTNFIYGNVTYAIEYVEQLLELLSLYQDYYSRPAPAIQEKTEEVDIDFVKSDLVKLLDSMKSGAERIRNLVLSLRNFSRLDEAQIKRVDLHEGLDSTLVILQSQLDRGAIQIVKDYGQLPLVECSPGQLNQVFINILSNAIDALKDRQHCPTSPQGSWRFPNGEKGTPAHSTHLDNPVNHITESEILSFHYQAPAPTIWIRTGILQRTQEIFIQIADNGCGMTEEVQQYLFDPFFTTKPVGQGSGLGLAISHQIIVDKHRGSIDCHSVLGAGTELVIRLPRQQSPSLPKKTMNSGSANNS